MSNRSDKLLFRPTWANIHLDALENNLCVIKRHIPPSVKIMAMVKADAYGHGAVHVAKKLETLNVTALGVATVEEGMELREAGISRPILVMGGLMGVGAKAGEAMIEADLTPVIHSSGVLDDLEAYAAKKNVNVAVQLKVDTGMSRLGVMPEALEPILTKLKGLKHLYVEGVMTHLAEADNAGISNCQLDVFMACHSRIEKALGKIPIWHIANSGAILRGVPVEIPHAKECWARPGLALYGDAGACEDTLHELKPVMTIESRVALVKTVPEKTRVSYGGIFTTKRKSRLAVVPVGYADGYPWSVSGKAYVIVNGKRAPVAGRVTMDMIVVDVTDVPDVGVGDNVVLLGSQGNEKILLKELAGWAGTITYEILCGISKRMPRIYKDA